MDFRICFLLFAGFGVQDSGGGLGLWFNLLRALSWSAGFVVEAHATWAFGLRLRWYTV